ncbi:MAG: hypothetical protein K6F54_04695 [Lachnospiraceae bacterium]|nr:hypothetical protein [Lachnospiraceae bacterium]
MGKSKTHLENQKTGETLSAADLLKLFEEQIEKAESEFEKDKNLRTMSDEDWDKHLKSVDTTIQTNRDNSPVKESVIMKHPMSALPRNLWI